MIENAGLTKVDNLPMHYVGIGASAGGLEALQEFFTHTEKGSHFAYIVVQHLSPDYKSMMDELLAKVTDLPVHVAENDMLVEADNIYLIPPKKNLKIFHGKLILTEQERTATIINFPIDLFLSSLADDQGDKAIAIIMSGTGSDGTRGCRALKEAGGMVIAQDESTARFDGMPRSVIAAGLPDFVLPVDKIPSQLLAYARHPYTAREDQHRSLLDERSDITTIFSILRERSKIDFTFYKPSTIIRRIARRMTINQIADLTEYVQFLDRNPTEQTTLFRELLIGITSFFRNPEAFELLRNKWLFESMQKFVGDEFRIWCAGCSTGEEAYTLAIICSEITQQLGRPVDVKIFATDVDQEAITRAGMGVFPESIIADVPKTLLFKHFLRKGESFQISRHIREMVVFATHNLIKDPPFTNIDFISCRNLLIYLQPILQQVVFEAFNFALKPSGILMLGPSEAIGEAEVYFEALENRWKVFRSKGHRSSVFDRHRLANSPSFNSISPSRTSSRASSLAKRRDEEHILGDFLSIVAGDQIPFAMIVNEHMELLYVVGDASDYLAPPSGKIVNDVTQNVCKDLSLPLSTGLARCFKSLSEINFTNVRLSNAKNNLKVDLRIKPIPVRKGKDHLAAVFISECGIPYTSSSQRDYEASFDLDQEAQQRIADLEHELQLTRENLQATIEELETSNEELQATNEELLASNEELQSTNEELQSVNEELFTLNAEYQGKIVELTEAHNDLDNFMNTVQVIAVFVDENLDVRKFTSNARLLFSVIDNDIDRPFAHLTYQIENINLADIVQQVNDTGKAFIQEVLSTSGQWYQLKVTPYTISDRINSGVLIALYDIDALKKSQIDLLKLTQVVEQSSSAIVITDIDGIIEYVNPALLKLTGYRKEEVIGKNPRIWNSGEIPMEDYRELWTTILSGQAWRGTFHNRRKNGTLLWEAATISPIKDKDGNLTHFVAIKDEITETRELQGKITELTRLLEERNGDWRHAER